MSSKYEPFLFLCYHSPMCCYESPSEGQPRPKLLSWHIISFQRCRFLWSGLTKPHFFSHRCCRFSLQGWFCSNASRCWAYWPKNMLQYLPPSKVWSPIYANFPFVMKWGVPMERSKFQTCSVIGAFVLYTETCIYELEIDVYIHIYVLNRSTTRRPKR